MQKRYAKPVAKSYYMFGTHPVIAALSNPRRHIEHVLCNQTIFEKHRTLIMQYNYDIVKDEGLSKILQQTSNYLQQAPNHQGLAAKVRTIFHYNFDKFISTNITNKEEYKIAILDQVTDPQNIGSIIRSAVAFAVDALIMPSDHTPDENATIAKVASGTLENIEIIKVPNLCQAMLTLKKLGFWIIGFDSNSTINLSNSLFSKKIAMAFGAEGAGLRKLTSKTCDYLVRIPMTNNIESLNIANSATIAFYLAYVN